MKGGGPVAAGKTHDAGEVDVDASLVSRLVAAQFPQWAPLPIEPVEFDGWDNTTFRLGTRMTVRLPSAASYAPQVEKEQRWLPKLAPHLPLPIPVPLAKGVPGEGYPYPWSVYRWIEGEPATVGRIADPVEFATALADFLTALQSIDPGGGPLPGRHNFFRGGPLRVYDAETRQAISALEGRIDTDAATAVWEAALAAGWHGAPVWLHGDIADGNLLVEGAGWSPSSTSVLRAWATPRATWQSPGTSLEAKARTRSARTFGRTKQPGRGVAVGRYGRA